MENDMDYDDMFDDYSPEMLDDMYDHMYQEEVTENDYLHGVSTYSLKELWKDCLVPTISDGLSASCRLLVCCLLLWLTSSLRYIPKFWIHLTSLLAGLYCLYIFFGAELLYVVALAVLGYGTLLVIHFFWGRWRGVVCSSVCVAFFIICELFVVEQTQWHKIRGSQMVLVMKIISLAFDLDSSLHSLPSPIQCLGYFLSVGSVIFGPWVSFSTYNSFLQQRNGCIDWGWKVIRSLLMAFFFLTVSTCWSVWLLQYDSWRWIAAYKDALSFRSSHYFISYLSEATTVAMGISSSPNAWEFSVTSPSHIEVPRSLVEVVIYWNMPMHYWLKTYVFKMAKPLGNFAAVFLTYAASSLLHGLNFQLAAVLLSLGFYTYVEHVLRQKLAGAFDACILARKCKKDCSHVYKNYHPYVIATNLCFGILALFHLAYLGVMFDSSSTEQEEGYSMQHTLEKWMDLDFASHWVALATYLFNILI